MAALRYLLRSSNGRASASVSEFRLRAQRSETWVPFRTF